MKIFNEPNLSGDWKCPICKKNTKIPVTLIGIDGSQEGNIMQAEQFHVECLELTFNKELKVLVMCVED